MAKIRVCLDTMDENYIGDCKGCDCKSIHVENDLCDVECCFTEKKCLSSEKALEIFRKGIITVEDMVEGEIEGCSGNQRNTKPPSRLRLKMLMDWGLIIFRKFLIL
jgi:hypothetical protein